jgi:23S rRNA (cytidine1920-2'-O)/16S rRNA (cytidine1409-2'-O)-methyltransferase
MEKERADILVVRQGLADSREKAKRFIMAGQIYTEKAMRVDKPGEKLPVTTQLTLKGEDVPYVSRGGFKLVKAMETFAIGFAEKKVLDIGSSTGGFTDVALQNGAKLSYALDVGTNQLDWKLRSDERVVVMEQTNFRYSKPEDFVEGQPDIATIDVSFISLDLILPALRPILKTDGLVAALVKPQFEAGKDKVGKKGIVRDKKVHKDVIIHTMQTAIGLGFDVSGLTYSPITGGTGNIEFLMLLTNTDGEPGQIDAAIDIDAVIDEAHSVFH